MRKAFRKSFVFLDQAQRRRTTTLKAVSRLKGNERDILKKATNKKAEGISQ